MFRALPVSAELLLRLRRALGGAGATPELPRPCVPEPSRAWHRGTGAPGPSSLFVEGSEQGAGDKGGQMLMFYAQAKVLLALSGEQHPRVCPLGLSCRGHQGLARVAWSGLGSRKQKLGQFTHRTEGCCLCHSERWRFLLPDRAELGTCNHV